MIPNQGHCVVLPRVMALLETRIKRAGQLEAQQFVTSILVGVYFSDTPKSEELQHDGSIVGGSEWQWFRTANNNNNNNIHLFQTHNACMYNMSI